MGNYAVILGEDERDQPRLSHSTCREEKIMLQQTVAFIKSIQAFRRPFSKLQRHFKHQKFKIEMHVYSVSHPAKGLNWQILHTCIR